MLSSRSPQPCSAGPLWPLVVILGEIADRVVRERAAAETEISPETRIGAGSDPLARGDGAR